MQYYYSLSRGEVPGPLPEADRFKSIPVHGFENMGQVGFVKNLLTALRIPTDNIRSLSYRPNFGERWNFLGSWQRTEGDFSLYKALGKLPPIASLETTAHEAAHTASPYVEKNSRLFGSEERRLAAADTATQVANRTRETGRYLNGYHKALHRDLMGGRITADRFNEETWAIMTGLKYSNPMHLTEVLEAQDASLKRRGIKSRDTANDLLVKSDQALMRLTKFKTAGEMHQHLKGVRESLPHFVTPLSSYHPENIFNGARQRITDFTDFLIRLQEQFAGFPYFGTQPSV